jgi:hypothetical protein
MAKKALAAPPSSPVKAAAPPAGGTVVSAYLAYSKAVRAEVKASMPSDASGAAIMREIGARWKALSKEEKKPYVNLRNAWLFSQGRTPKNLGGACRGLPPGWIKEL